MFTFGIVTLILLGFATSMIVFAQNDTVEEVKTYIQNEDSTETLSEESEIAFNPELTLAFNTEAINEKIEADRSELARIEAEKKEQERQAALKKQREEAARLAALQKQQTQASPAPTPKPAPTPTPTTPQGDGIDHWSGRLAYWCGIYGCDAAKMTEVIRCESGGRQSAYNSVGPYIGIFQFLTSTFNANAARIGIAGANVYNGEHQVQTAAWMFSKGQAWQWPSCSRKAGLL